jgi:tRNA(Ile)-lysidine synthase
VLFRVLRGSGLAGLAGILPVTSEGLIRPLLEITRAEVEEFLRARSIDWREDASNRDARFARNRIRHGLLPELEREWNPGIREALGRLADLAGEEERWWAAKIERLARKLCLESDGGVEVSVEVRADSLASLPKAVSRRLVRHVIRHLVRRAGATVARFGQVDFEQVDKVIELARSQRGSGCLELPGLLVVRSFDWLRFTVAGAAALEPRPVAIEVPGRYRWAGGTVCVDLTSNQNGAAKPNGAGKSAGAGCVRLKWKGPYDSALLELRGWRDGDHYRPWGCTRDQKLKEMFQKARVPSWKRDFWPIITNESKILWAREFGVAAEFAWERGSGRSLCIWEEKDEPA